MEQGTVVVRCAQCGTKNRVLEKRGKKQARCGRCQAVLPVGGGSGRPVHVTDHTFSREVLSHGGAVIVDCWAPWCGPCRTVSPILDQLASEYTDRVKVAKLNVDENPQTASRYGIQSIPTLLLFKGGSQVDRLVGARPKSEIEQRFKSLL